MAEDKNKLEEKVNATFEGLQQNNAVQMIGTTLLPAYKKNKNKINEMVGYAEDNFRTSRWLKDNGYTALSIYHLEQSAELITK